MAYWPRCRWRSPSSWSGSEAGPYDYSSPDYSFGHSDEESYGNERSYADYMDDQGSIWDDQFLSDPSENGEGISCLKDLSMKAVVKLIKNRSLPVVSMVGSLPAAFKCDIVMALARGNRRFYESLELLLSSAEIVLPALSVASKRAEMFAVIQKLIMFIGAEFISALVKSVEDKLASSDPAESARLFLQVSILASFLLDSAWYNFAEGVLRNLLTCSSVGAAEAGNNDHEVGDAYPNDDNGDLKDDNGDPNDDNGDLKPSDCDPKTGDGDPKAGDDDFKPGNDDHKADNDDPDDDNGDLKPSDCDPEAGDGDPKTGSDDPKAGSGNLKHGDDDHKVIGIKLLLLSALTMQLKLTEATELMNELGCLNVLNGGDGTADIKIMQLRASFNAESCRLYLEKSAFGPAYSAAMAAVSCLREEHAARLVVDVYRVASRACVMRRKLDAAQVLAREAFLLARDKLGPRHVAYAEAVADLAFYWQSTGERRKATEHYLTALKIFKEIDSDNNYHEMKIRELLAQMKVDLRTNDWGSMYCSLIKTVAFEEPLDEEYEDSHFGLPVDDSWYQMHIIRAFHLVGRAPHPLAANGRRIDAVFSLNIYDDVCQEKLEVHWKQERAVDAEKEFRVPDYVKTKLVSSLDIAGETFGESSLQTARHLDSLGYFYRKTLNLSLAEEALNRSLSAKEALLDPDDPEVAATLRQLAVVSFLRREFDRAAHLLVRCVDITVKTADERTARSDFNFLIACYAQAENFDAVQEWTQRYNEWKVAHTVPLVFVADNPAVDFPLESGLDVSADAPLSLADVVEELKRLGAFQ